MSKFNTSSKLSFVDQSVTQLKRRAILTDIEIQPPNHFENTERLIWKEILVERKNVGLSAITSADSLSFEMLVELAVKHRARIDMSSSERATYLKLMDEFGLLPQSRKGSQAAAPTNRFAKHV